MTRSLPWLAALLVCLSGCTAETSRTETPRTGAPPAASVDTDALESLEERTEALANRLLDLSVTARGARGESLRPYFAPTVRLALPSPAPETQAEWEFVRRRAWPVPEAREVTGDEASAALAELLAHFGEREDVRFKVKSSHEAPPGPDGAARLEGHFKSWVVGRDGEGRREWFRGTGRVTGEHRGEDWVVTELAFEDAGSLVALRDLHAEVSAQAGMAYRDPSFVERGSQGLLAHGSATVDVDGDGLIDIFTTGIDRNFLYLNEGDGTFREAAGPAGLLATPVAGSAALFVDVDDDGDRDLFISAVGPQMLFENRLVPDGRLFFRDVSRRSGVNVDTVGFSVAAGDLNGDGRVDLHVAAYGHYGRVMPDSWAGASNGVPNLTFLNNGDGTFEEAGARLGLADHRWGYAAAIVDLDGDGRLDVVTGNDFGGPNGAFMNRGDRFVDEASARGLAVPGFAMGLSLGDPDADGDLDLHVTKMSSTAGNRILGRMGADELPGKDELATLAGGNSLFLNQGDGTFQDVSAQAGPFGAGWAWGGGFVDADNDGLDDLYTPNGFISGKSLADT